MFPKPQRWTNKKWRDAAKGQPCTLRLQMICNLNDETTVFAHAPGAGMGMKSDDFNGCDACSNCHDVLDGRVRTYLTLANIREEFERARYETIANRLRRGIVK